MGKKDGYGVGERFQFKADFMKEVSVLGVDETSEGLTARTILQKLK